jgi:hypothetical protein
MRFVKLNIYFFGMYGLLTCIWYGLTGRFNQNAADSFREILVTSAFFSLAFSLLVLFWYRRTSIRIPLKNVSKKELNLKLEQTGYTREEQPGKQQPQTYKPVPPKASAMAGKIFLAQDASYYHLNGPRKFLKQIGEQ